MAKDWFKPLESMLSGVGVGQHVPDTVEVPAEDVLKSRDGSKVIFDSVALGTVNHAAEFARQSVEERTAKKLKEVARQAVIDEMPGPGILIVEQGVVRYSRFNQIDWKSEDLLKELKASEHWEDIKIEGVDTKMAQVLAEGHEGLKEILDRYKTKVTQKLEYKAFKGREEPPATN